MTSVRNVRSSFAKAALLASFILGVVGVVQTSSAAVATISTTKHNLGSGGTGSNKSSGTAEICVFCHTPHGADVSTAGAPLWNKRLDTPAATYTMYSPIDSTDGEVLSALAGVTLPCLTCHDGTQAMDNIINAPGSGGYTANGGGNDGLGWSWSGARVDATGKLTGVAALGTDLSNDHPIGIEYCGGGLGYGGGTSVSGTCSDADFEVPIAATIGTGQRMWVETGADTARAKSDLFLFNRTFAGGAGPSVECASCHDVHGGQSGTTFLRVANTGSSLCLSCHTK